jgi:hypothetical protein
VRRAGTIPRRVGDLVIAIGELAANAFAHTSGPGTVTLWATGSCDLVEIRTSPAGTAIRLHMHLDP